MALGRNALLPVTNALDLKFLAICASKCLYLGTQAETMLSEKWLKALHTLNLGGEDCNNTTQYIVPDNPLVEEGCVLSSGSENLPDIRSMSAIHHHNHQRKWDSPWQDDNTRLQKPGDHPQFQEKRSRSERAILGALGEFRGILGAALGIGNSILGIRNSILGMASHDFINTKPTILGATLGAIPGIAANPPERFSFAPAFSERFFKNWGWSPRTRRLLFTIAAQQCRVLISKNITSASVKGMGIICGAVG